MYTGITAKLTILQGEEEKEIAYISNFSIEENRDMIEVSKLGSVTKEKIPSTLSWSASADGAADFALVNGQKDLRDAMTNGTILNVKFYLDETTYLTGQAYVESLSTEVSSDDKTSVSISLAGTGALTMSVA